MSDDMVRQNGTELGKPSLTHPVQRMREEPSYKGRKSKEVGRVADDAVLLLTSHESGMEGKASTEFRHSKNGRSVYYPMWDY
jgi:hypothetical protein